MYTGDTPIHTCTCLRTLPVNDTKMLVAQVFRKLHFAKAKALAQTCNTLKY